MSFDGAVVAKDLEGLREMLANNAEAVSRLDRCLSQLRAAGVVETVTPVPEAVAVPVVSAAPDAPVADSGETEQHQAEQLGFVDAPTPSRK